MGLKWVEMAGANKGVVLNLLAFIGSDPVCVAPYPKNGVWGCPPSEQGFRVDQLANDPVSVDVYHQETVLDLQRSVDNPKKRPSEAPGATNVGPR